MNGEFLRSEGQMTSCYGLARVVTVKNGGKTE